MQIDLLRRAGQGLRAGWRVLLVLAALGLGARITMAGDVPLDEPGFTSYVAKAFSGALPGWKVTVKGPLALNILPPKGDDGHQAYLHTVYGFCQRNPPACADAVRIHVEQMSATYKQGDVRPTRAALRAVVRQVEYVEQMRRAYASKGLGEPVAVPLLAGLWAVCAVDLPQAIEYLNPRDLKTLKLSREQAMEQCKANTAKTLPPLAGQVGVMPAHHIGMLPSDPYESSWLLLPEAWAPFAGKAKGKLIVAVPSTDVVLYAFHTDKKTVAKMRLAIEDVASKSNRPLSPEVFRWTKKGWKVLPP